MLFDINVATVTDDENYSLPVEVAEALRVPVIRYEGGLVSFNVICACLDQTAQQEVMNTCRMTGDAVALSDLMLYLGNSLLGDIFTDENHGASSSAGLL